MVVLEALALGVPIVAHSVGGLPELLTGSPIGHLVPLAGPGSSSRRPSKPLRARPVREANQARASALPAAAR